MSRHEHDDHNDGSYQPSASSLQPGSVSPRPRSREHKQRTLRRNERNQMQAQPIQGLPSPVTAARGAADLAPPRILVSPPPRAQPSPNTEIAVLPDGGVEIPQGFHFDQADQGRYRSREDDQGDGGADQLRALGRFGLGMFKGLRNLPAAIVRAGRGTKPQQEAEPTPEETPEGRNNLQIDEDVETYITQNDEDEEARIREDELLRAYIQRRRRHRDRAIRHAERIRRQPYVPAPQPVPLPGTHTPAPSATGAIEAEEIAAEREALMRAQERERARNIYAAEAVKLRVPSSVTHTSITPRTHHRAASAPLPPRIFSRWTAQRNSMGQRYENRSDGEPVSSTSPLTFAGLLRLIKQIRDMPWVGERVAADYIPGGTRRSTSGYTSSAGYPGSESEVSYIPPTIPPQTVQSWYAARESILLLPEGVAPPPGFIPYPDHYSPPPEGMAEDRVPSPSSHTHVEAPVPIHASGPSYVNGEGYRHIPAEASVTGQSYIFVPAQNAAGRDKNAGGSHVSASYASRNPG